MSFVRGVVLLVATVTSADKIAWISDIHLDPFYDPVANQGTYCRNIHGGTKPVARHSNKFGPDIGLLDTGFDDLTTKAALTVPAYYGRYGCDPPVGLVRSMMTSIKATHPDYIIVTGDFSAHYWGSGARKLRWQALKNATEELYASFKSYSDTKVIYCVGNNDVGQDYQPESNDNWNKKLFDIWSPRSVPADQNQVTDWQKTPRFVQTFLDGLYYRVEVNDRITVICLNTVWFSVHTEPTKQALFQLTWFEDQLSQIQKSGKQAVVAGHIPPGQALFRTDNNAFIIEKQWHDQYEKGYSKIIRRFRDLIITQMYGHYHTDEFRVMAYHSQPFALVLMAPGVCGSHGTNPAWRLMELTTNERNNRTVLNDYKQYFTPLYGDDQSLGTFSREPLKWQIAYNALDIYPELTSKGIWDYQVDNLADYWYRESVGGGYPPLFILRCILVDAQWQDWDLCVEEQLQNRIVELENKNIRVVKT